MSYYLDIVKKAVTYSNINEGDRTRILALLNTVIDTEEMYMILDPRTLQESHKEDILDTRVYTNMQITPIYNHCLYFNTSQKSNDFVRDFNLLYPDPLANIYFGPRYQSETVKVQDVSRYLSLSEDIAVTPSKVIGILPSTVYDYIDNYAKIYYGEPPRECSLTPSLNVINFYRKILLPDGESLYFPVIGDLTNRGGLGLNFNHFFFLNFKAIQEFITQPLSASKIDISWSNYTINSLSYHKNSRSLNMYFMPESQLLEYLNNTGIKYSFVEEDCINLEYKKLPGGLEGIQTQPGQEDNVISNQGGTGDRTTDEMGTSVPENPATTTSLLGSTYALNYNHMLKIQGEIWKPEFLETLNSLTNAPQSAIIGCVLFPFDITQNGNKPGVLETSTVTLGTYNIDMTEISTAYKVYPSFSMKYPIGSYDMKLYFGGFLDYDPYTKISIYLPYIGIQTLEPKKIQGKKITVYYLIDISTGAGKAVLEDEKGNILYTFSCNLGIEISFNSSNFGAIQQKIIMGGITAAIGGVVGGGIGAAGGALAGGAMSSVNSTIGSATYTSTGSTGTSIERALPQDVFFIIERPETAVPTDYNRIYGRPSLITTKLGSLKGYTTIENARLDTIATVEEETEIINKLREGVVIL